MVGPPNFRFLHFTICMLFLNFYKSGKDRKINTPKKKKKKSDGSHCPQDKVQTLLMVHEAFAVWLLCASSFSHPTSLLHSPPAVMTADSSLNIPVLSGISWYLCPEALSPG